MKTVVTGGAGFIGSHLVKRLLAQGREVVIADDLSRGSRRNLDDLGIALGLQPVDLRDYRQASRVIEGAEVVYHLAARVGGVDYLHGTESRELAALQANLVIDANVFRACADYKVPRLIYASSVAVYPVVAQESPQAVLREEDLHPFSPEGGYGWAKLMGEVQLGWMDSISMGIARIFNVFGENGALDATAHVVLDLMRKAIRYPQEPFEVWGDGTQTRDFLYISDAVEALIRLEEKASNPPLIVNIGSGKAVAIATLAEEIARLSGKGMKPRYDPARPVGPRSRTADIGRARTYLGWQPRVSLEEGLQRTYAWAKRRLAERGHA